MDCFLFFRV